MPSRLFALGSNGAGQLGIGHREDVSTPQECIFDASTPLADDESIMAIRAGGNHTLVLTSSGRVFATGSRNALPAEEADHNSFHLLNIESVFRLSSASKVTNIATSWDASYFVVDKQVVCACGTGSKGELGLGVGKNLVAAPGVSLDLGMYGDGSATIQDISGGLSHVVLITSDGGVYGWGTSRKGELGEDTKEKKIVWKPWKIDVGFHASSVVAGRNLTFVRGGKNQQILLGSAKQFPSGISLDLATTTEVSCGWSNLYALDSGELQAIGHHDRGQVPLIKLPMLTHFAPGSEHGVGCTGDGKVIAFGWGEHGNCGEPMDVRGNVAGRFNTITIPRNKDDSVCLIAAGCATTFVAVRSPDPPAEP